MRVNYRFLDTNTAHVIDLMQMILDSLCLEDDVRFIIADALDHICRRKCPDIIDGEIIDSFYVEVIEKE